MFRTNVIYDKIDKPKSVVIDKRTVPFAVHKAVNDNAVKQFTDEINAEQFKKGFDIQRDSLIRLDLVVGENSSVLIFSFHHILMDGYCAAMIADIIMKNYGKMIGRQCDNDVEYVPFSTYQDWIVAQDMSKSCEYWKEYLKGISSVQPLDLVQFGSDKKKNIGHSSLTIEFTPLETQGLISIASAGNATLNICMQWLWGLTLCKLWPNIRKLLIDSIRNRKTCSSNNGISSTFIHPLQLGQVSLLLLSYAIYQFKSRCLLFIYWLMIIGLIWMCVCCGARSALVPVLLVLAIYIVHYKKKSYIVSAILGGVALLFFCYPMLPKEVRTTVEGIVLFWDDKAAVKADIHGSSVDGRTEQLAYAFQAIDNRLLMGYGEGHVRNYGSTHPGLLGYESIVLEELVDSGILGVVIFFTFYIFLYKGLLMKCISKREKGRVHSLCLPFLLSICLTGVSYSFFTLYVILYFLTLYNIINGRKQRFYIERNCICHS